MNIITNQKPLMDYEAFKNALKKNIQNYVDRPINFIEQDSTKVNENLESLTLRLAGENVSPIIYPQQLYEAYCAGIPLSVITASAANTLKQAHKYSEIPDITPENAQKHIRFSLVNKAWNQKLLATCPYKEVLDLAAVPRWYEENSVFLIDNNILQILGMTADEVLDIAGRNTVSEHYVCKDISSAIHEAMFVDGVEAELVDELYPIGKSPLYLLSNQTGIDGSCAILSERFMKKTARQLGAKELCLIPSSRDEMLAANIAAIDITNIKNTVMSVNRNLRLFSPGGALSNSVYCYNATTHALSILQ